MNYSNPLDAVPDVSLETRLIITENQCALSSLVVRTFDRNLAPGVARRLESHI